MHQNLLQRSTNALGFMSVISLHSDHQHVSATYVVIFRMVTTRIHMCRNHCGMISTHFICILVVTTLKMATWMAETCQCSLYNDTSFICPSTIQINHQPDATVFQFIILTFVYSSTCLGRFPTHHQELNDCSVSLWFYLRIVVIVVLCS
jgi:hypothetical protein